MSEIYDSLKGNRYDEGDYNYQKDKFMMGLIEKYCDEIWY